MSNRRGPRALLVVCGAAVALGSGAAVAAAPATGVIEQEQGRSGCISLSGTGGACARGRVLESPSAIALSADGRSAYVASPSRGHRGTRSRSRHRCAYAEAWPRRVRERLRRACQEDTSSGAEYAVAVSPDDRSVYSAGLDGRRSSIATPRRGSSRKSWARPGASTESRMECTRNSSIDWPQTVTISPDGVDVDVTSGDLGQDRDLRPRRDRGSATEGLVRRSRVSRRQRRTLHAGWVR